MSLLIAYSGALGGAERVLVEVAGSLKGEVCVACPPGPLADAARRRGVRVLALRSRSLVLRGAGSRDSRGWRGWRGWGGWRGWRGWRGSRIVTGAAAGRELAGHARELGRLTTDLDPDTIVLWGMRPALAWRLGMAPAIGRRVGSRAAAAARGRVVFAHHDMLPGPVIARLVRAAAARADAVVVNSRAVADDLDPSRELGSRLTVVHPGVDLPPTPSRRPDGPPVVVVIGALVGWKRVELALETIALARRAVPSLRLRVVGAPLASDDQTLERLRARAAAPDLAGAVQFAGAVADVGGELARATCLLHCAEREPFGLVVAEALAAGRPVVVPGAGGPAEIADPSCGMRYPPGDAAAAAAAIVALVTDPERARALGEAGRARVAERFGQERMRRGFAAVLAPAGAPPAADAPHAADAPRAADTPLEGDAPPAADAPRLALVTVSFNSEAVLGALLDGTARHLPGVRVIVVDCGSRDDSVRIARAHPAAVSVEAGTNLGFGRGSNLGLRHVTEPVTVLLNPDVELIDDSLLALAAALESRESERALLAPLVLSDDGSRQDTVHPAPGSAAELARLVLAPGRLGGRLGTAIAPWRSDAPRPVGWAVACALGGRTATMRALGPFADSIFMYGEDLELGLRAARAGVRTWFWPAARVIHRGGHSTAKAYGGEPFALLADGRHRAIAMTLGEPSARRDDRRQAALFASRAAVKRALGRDHRRERAQLRAVRGR